ncbi:hypothetical protein PLICRDRAFT_42989 [Plicaturopsis crispa FD-325 SS-3]|nr:hypothetical protein PLICRDRAFT_42989 [Plicaturopsis crispa FD-325 SS-3]
MDEAQREQQPLLRTEDVEQTVVYPIIHMIRSVSLFLVDTPLSFEALSAPDLTYTLIRPLHEKYSAIQQKGNMSVVFCFLLNRVHFMRDQNLTTTNVSRSRAALCEILAIRMLRDYGNSVLDLTLATTTSWMVYTGADPDVIAQAREDRDDLEDRVGNAIEMAIISKAKRFIKSTACQRVIDSIWTGKCVYQAQSSHSILSDTYKRTPIHFYDPHRAPLLDHYRLKVPAIRSVLEYVNFLILFILFVIAIETNETDVLNPPEILFMVYALGFTLEKVAAMQEHGIKVYFKGTWNGFDLAFVTTFLAYTFLRLYGVFHGSAWARRTGVDCLALIACLMFPRLAFVTLKNNLMVLSLRAMMMQFVVLMLIAAFCFGGFLYALWTLSRNQAQYSIGTIAWWMLDLWFGLDASGFDKATQFHGVFGPILMVTYACLSNTLLLTVLVSILSNTFNKVNEDAAAEAMFRKAVSTIEGVKADSLFSYQPPVNLIALIIMLPASYILTPRWFHKVNVFMIRTTSFPILLCIAWYERQSKKNGSTGFYETVAAAAEKVFDTLPRNFRRLTFFEGLAGTDADIDAVFELEEEMDSALDTQEYGTFPTNDDLRQRRMSIMSQRRRSSGNHQKRSPSPHRAERPPVSPTTAIPRQRVNSVLHRGAEMATSFTSPLAQIFQPLVVDEDIPEDPSAHPGGPVSYGPASRRRLSSMQSVQRRTPTDNHLSQVQSLGLRKFPSQGSGSRHEPPLSESPKENDGGIKPVGQIEEDEKNSGSLSQWSQRLNTIEESQRRIEAMLAQLSKH